MKKMKIQIESVNMIYEGGEVVLVKVDYTARGEVLRSGRGTLELKAEEYEGNESVVKLESMVRDALINELNNEDEEDAE